MWPFKEERTSPGLDCRHEAQDLRVRSNGMTITVELICTFKDCRRVLMQRHVFAWAKKFDTHG